MIKKFSGTLRVGVSLLLVLSTVIVQSRAGAQQQAIAFTNVNVIPFDRERILAGQTVIVRDGRIAEIGPAEKLKVPAGALQIDGRGKYLMPGLADMQPPLYPGGDERARPIGRAHV